MLVETIDRYGEAIEADLHREFGLDLLDFFRRVHPFAKLDRLIARLLRIPRSFYRLALVEDEELAQQILETYGDEEVEDGGPDLAVWSPEMARLTDIFDRLGELVAVTAAAHGQGSRPKAAPRPSSAMDKALAQRSLERIDGIIAEVEEAQRRYAARHEED